MKWTKVDALTRKDHWYLTEDDDVRFLRLYTAHEGFAYSETNQLISNLKKTMDRRGRNEWVFKERAIAQAVNELRVAIGKADLSAWTVVPIPPSKAKTDPLHDPRMAEIARSVFEDVRELLVQKDSATASHTTSNRPPPDDLAKNWTLDKKLAIPSPIQVVILDDVLTTGAHFVAAKKFLIERIPTLTRVIGFFIARTDHGASQSAEQEFEPT